MSTNNRFVAKNGVDNNSKTLTNVLDPVNAQDAATKAFSSNASNITSGTLSTSVLGNSTLYIGTTATALNRASGNQALTGISSISFPGSTSGTAILQAAAVAGTPSLILPSASGTLALTTDNVSSATALQTARTLWGQSFDGTANVTGNLTSVGNITGTAGVTLTATSGTLALAATGANVITASTNGSERMRIDSSGQIGIGFTTVSSKLQVKTTSNAGLEFDAGVTGDDSRIISYDRTANLPKTFAIDGSQITFRTNSAAGGGTERMRIDSSGNVGIGGSPTASVNVTVTSSYESILNLNTSAASGGYITLYRSGANANIIGAYKSASGGGTAINQDALLLRSSNGIAFAPASGTASWMVNTSGHFIPVTDAVGDIGATTNRVGNIYSGSYRFSSTTQFITNGVSSPEGAVTASVGSLFLRADGGSGTTLYVKESGTGNTGWTAVSSSAGSGNLTDSTTFFIDNTDNTKKMQFEVSGVTTGTTRTLTVPNVSGTIITTGDTGTVTNTMLAGSIANAKLTNSSVTVNGSSISLGGSATVTANTTNALTIGTGLSGTSFNGSSAVTIAIDSTVATLTGSQTLTNKTFGGYVETVYAITDGPSVDINPANGSIQTWTLGASRSPTASSFTAGQSVLLSITGGGNGITWPSVTWKTNSGTAPTLNSSGVTAISLWKIGSTIYGARIGDA